MIECFLFKDSCLHNIDKKQSSYAYSFDREQWEIMSSCCYVFSTRETLKRKQFILAATTRLNFDRSLSRQGLLPPEFGSRTKLFTLHLQIQTRIFKHRLIVHVRLVHMVAFRGLRHVYTRYLKVSFRDTNGISYTQYLKISCSGLRQVSINCLRVSVPED